MSELFSTTLLYSLITIIALLILYILHLNIQFYIEKTNFQIKLYALQDLIIEISKKQLGQQEQLSLSEELEKIINSSQHRLNNDIFELNYDLFEIASKNNLI